jgi:hypothetical protein
MTDGGNVTQLRSVLRSDLIQPIDPRIKLVRDWWGIEPEPIEDIVEGLVPKRLSYAICRSRRKWQVFRHVK